MARFLYAWELGSNFGHMTTFNEIAQELTGRGHEVYVALHNLADAGQFFDRAGVKYLQAPVWLKPSKADTAPPLNYAEVIERYGFADAPGLRTLLAAWRQLFELARPEVVIANAAPSALLAARSRNFKLCVIGPGYHAPPPTVPMPAFREWEKVSPAALLASESRLVAVANTASAPLGIPPLAALRDLFAVDQQFLTTFKELDHFPSRNDGSYYGAQFSTTDGISVDWPEATGKRIFAYVRPSSPHFRPLLSALKARTSSVIVSAPGITSAELKEYSAPQLRIVATAVNISSIRERCDLAVSAGGHGTIAAFLCAGVPVLALPNHMEQMLIARAAARTGAAAFLLGKESAAYSTLINEMLGTPSYRHRACAFADRYRDFEPRAQAARIATELEALAG